MMNDNEFDGTENYQEEMFFLNTRRLRSYRPLYFIFFFVFSIIGIVANILYQNFVAAPEASGYDIAYIIIKDVPAVFVISGALAYSLTEVIKMIAEMVLEALDKRAKRKAAEQAAKAFAEGVAKGMAEGMAEGVAKTSAWYEEKQASEERGEPFDEPFPGSDEDTTRDRTSD